MRIKVYDIFRIENINFVSVLKSQSIIASNNPKYFTEL